MSMEFRRQEDEVDLHGKLRTGRSSYNFRRSVGAYGAGHCVKSLKRSFIKIYGINRRITNLFVE